jgi:hypothetical protein
MQRIHQAFQLAKHIMWKARQQLQQQQYNNRAQELLYEIGDRVLLTMKTPLIKTSKKLIPRFIGPYRVTKVYLNITVEIQEYTGKQTQLVHVNRLKPLCESMIWRDLPHVTLDTVDRPLPDLNRSSSSETDTNSPPLSPVPNHNMSPNASFELLMMFQTEALVFLSSLTLQTFVLPPTPLRIHRPQLSITPSPT